MKSTCLVLLAVLACILSVHSEATTSKSTSAKRKDSAPKIQAPPRTKVLPPALNDSTSAPQKAPPSKSSKQSGPPTLNKSQKSIPPKPAASKSKKNA